MTVHDAAFLATFFALMGAVLTVAILRASGNRQGARRMFGGLAMFPLVYGDAWVAVALAKRAPLGGGDAQCVDSGCTAVESVKTTPRESTDLYDVTLCLFSRAERTPTSYGVHLAANEKTDIYRVDGWGNRYLLNGSLLPAGARQLGGSPDGKSWGACPMAGECVATHSAKGLDRNAAGKPHWS